MNTDDYRGLKGVRPNVRNGMPWCATDACPSYDGKRCDKLGHRPDVLCEPAVVELVRLVGEQK